MNKVQSVRYKSFLVLISFLATFPIFGEEYCHGSDRSLSEIFSSAEEAEQPVDARNSVEESQKSYVKIFQTLAKEHKLSDEEFKKLDPRSFGFVEVSPLVIAKINPNFVKNGVMTFLMGSPDNEKGRFSGLKRFEDLHNPENQKIVQIEKPFEIAKTVVTAAQWALVMDKPLPSDGFNRPKVGTSLNDAVSLFDAQKFLERLNTLDPTHVYRLPTSEEFEFAARAGSSKAYPEFESTGLSEEQIKTRLLDYVVFDAEKMADVATKKPNALGLFDMHGNVLEWTTSEISIEGQTFSVIRGGGTWKEKNPDEFRSASSKAINPGWNGPGEVGFRVVRTPKTDK